MPNPMDALFADNRPIADMPFGAEEHDAAERANVANRVRSILQACAVRVADDIAKLGCTGVMANAAAVVNVAGMEPRVPDLSYSAQHAAQFLRIGLAGGGVGLPCFVPITRYCLVHETIGGLEPGQLQMYPEYADAISRELTPPEKARVALIEQARQRGRKDPDKAVDILAGRDIAAEEAIQHALTDEQPKADVLHIPAAPVAAEWVCPDHKELNYQCRYCVAQAVVEGPLVPVCAVMLGTCDLSAGIAASSVPAGDIVRDVDPYLAGLDSEKLYTAAAVFVRVAKFTRKLSRE
jgi:hypothetical protein